MTDSRFYLTPKPLSVTELAHISGAKILPAFEAKANVTLIIDIAPLDRAEDQNLSFLDNTKYRDQLSQTKAGACFVREDAVGLVPKETIPLVADDPYMAYALASQQLYPDPSWRKSYFADTASIHPSAKVGARCVIDHNVYIGKHVHIGDGAWIKPNTVIGHGVTIGKKAIIGSNVTAVCCDIGDYARIGAGTRIGQEGFGFAMSPKGHQRVPQIGIVKLGDRVRVGANVTIDRGSLQDTVIGSDTIIDNLVQIAHNVQIGRGCVIVSQVGISGSTVIEDFVVLAGQVGIGGHIRIGAGTQIGAQSGVIQNVAPQSKLMGTPAIPLRQFFRQVKMLENWRRSKKS